MSSYTDRFSYETARLSRDVRNAIDWYLDDGDISRAELASRLEVTPGRVSQILSEGENLTLRTLAAVAASLDAHFTIDLVPNDQTDQPASQSSAPAAGEDSPASRARARGRAG